MSEYIEGKTVDYFEKGEVKNNYLNKVIDDYQYSFAKLPMEDVYGLYEDVRLAKQELSALCSEIERLKMQHEVDKKLIVEHIKKESHYIPEIERLKGELKELESTLKDKDKLLIKYRLRGY